MAEQDIKINDPMLNLVVAALGLAILNRAGIDALREMLKNQGIVIDEAEFKALRPENLLPVLDELRTKAPEIGAMLPSLRSMLASGLFE